jgi:hypothetical protein
VLIVYVRISTEGSCYLIHVVVGEVQNNGPETAKFVEVSATLYDSNNKVIDTESTFTKPIDIDTGQKAPFGITVGIDKVMGGDLSITDHYAVQASPS